MRTAKAYLYGKCPTCKGLGWLDASDPAEHLVALERCIPCDGTGERMLLVELPADWPPCEVCGERCDSQLQGMESNDGQPWPTCGGCCDDELVDDVDELPTQPWPLAAPPMVRAEGGGAR